MFSNEVELVSKVGIIVFLPVMLWQLIEQFKKKESSGSDVAKNQSEMETKLWQFQHFLCGNKKKTESESLKMRK